MSGRPPSVLLLLPSFVPRDAVGNDVCGMYHVLRDAGYTVTIEAEHVDEAFRDIATSPRDDRSYGVKPPDLLIYHHSIGWPRGESILAQTRSQTAIRYHNVTPPKFFVKYARRYYQACIDGQLSTRRVARHSSAIFWGASRYNAEELIALGTPRERCRSIAPFNPVEELEHIPLEPSTLGRFRDGRFNIFFVGGIKPNKGHALALRVFAAYRKVYDPTARLIFAGSYDPGLSTYLESIRSLAIRLGVSADVMFEHGVSPSRLKAFYYSAGVFLCTSEHEGFCVPLVEAMALRVPILALGQTAIPETLGDAGIVHEQFDAAVFAGSIERLRRDPQLRLDLAECGRRRYELEYQPEVLGRKLLKLVGELRELQNA
jgi:glycosyltransferase involved in cell wall biosynthesis